MTDDELIYLTASDALEQFSSGALSPVELMRAVLARADAAEPRINAFAARFDEQALARAKAAEHAYRDGTAPPLAGLPIAAKLDLRIAGHPADQASLHFKGALAEETDVVPRRIAQAGGIVHARTTMPEFGVASFTHSALYGTTRNPWNTEFSPGGSSGGSAASLAAGTSVLATGSDSAGSIRMPAGYCGVVGYKPTRGRIPSPPAKWANPLYSQGVLARTVADCALFANVLSGPDPADPSSLPAAPLLRAAPEVDGLRVAVSQTLGGFAVEPAIRRATAAAAMSLRSAGAEVGLTEPAWDAASVQWAARVLLEMHAGPAEQLDRQLMMPYAAVVLDGFRERTAADYAEAVKHQAAAWHALRDVLTEADVLICPTQGLFGFLAGEDYVTTQPVIDGKEVKYPYDTHLCLPFNLLNSCPVLSVPSGFGPGNVPLSVQIVGKPHCDSDVFAVGAAIERYHRGYPGFASVRPELGLPEPVQHSPGL
ncbi:amidase [Amycolatopsis rubida]|uniref:Aspartyl-tRNA(Asn)/glutamyl-tRNA(Gln) amidotransferase subunit A n=1 Tax=Amycolatopsis rubida TaxID=112413 RepID=A0A1I5EEC9_9PSEU|nr:amidase [Amycolatopsis rubida]SFO09817.1 aspartyl-tRNA(Asn)/glutamyl-tRNA(Gln) amidotransferase subunit A [Amycolatopsis rubida]